MALRPIGPSHLWIVRHGESAGNVARDRAEAAGEPMIQLASRDMDVPLSALGDRQARALATWFGNRPSDGRPTVVMSSPYRRAIDTAGHVAQPQDLEAIIDERLREREFGVLDRLTRTGIERQHADQAAMMTLLGKFYHRPPGGESWCDVILRLRSFVDGLCQEYPDERVLVVCHGVVVLCFRYLLERLSEEQLLRIDAEQPIANCAMLSYVRREGSRMPHALELVASNQLAPMHEAGAEVTSRPDPPVAAR